VIALKHKTLIITLLILALAVSGTGRYVVPPAHAIGVANVVVTNVYWGSNPMNPTTARPGDVNDQMSVVLSNVGDDVARGVNATLILGPPLTYTYTVEGVAYTSTTVWKIAGDISAGQSFTLAYTVNVDPNATEGIYRYNLQVAYRSARELQQVNTSLPIDVPLWNGELHVQSVVTVPTKIYPDTKQVALKVFLANSGKGAAEDVQLQLVLTRPFTASSSGSDRIYVGNIPAGQVSEADFVVDVASDAQFGQYSVILGEQLGNGLIPIGQVPVYVNEKVTFNILSVTPNVVHAGDSGIVIRVEILNQGTVKADSVRAQLRVGNFFTGTLTDFLGTMLANETKVAFFTVDVDTKTQPGQYNLDLRFDWTQDNNALDDTMPLILTVQPAGVPFTLVIVLVVLVLAICGYMFMRRRKAKAAQASPTK
jgi:hypothetical protein